VLAAGAFALVSLRPGGGSINDAPEMALVPDAAMCAQFKMAPSCDYVPAAVQSLCRQCK